jgi:hypothetical protein
MKIKDLPPTTNLSGTKVKTHEGKVGYWKSQWQNGVWLTDGKTDRVYPQFVANLEQCLECEVTEEDVNL